MKRVGKYLLMFLAILSLTSYRRPQQHENDWVYEREKKGIKIFTRKSAWSKLRDSKATMTVSSSPEQMLTVLTDFDHYDNWLQRCKRSRLLARLNDHEFIVHLVFGAPWPLKDRDCVVRVNVDKDPKTGTILITELSEPKYINEEADVVRIQQMVCTWRLTPGKTGTEIVNEYSSNPGGNIPDWLTNTQSVENPLATFENLKQKAVSKKVSGNEQGGK